MVEWVTHCSYLAISMAQSIIMNRLLFFAVHFEGFTENHPFLFEGLQNILKGMWRVGPQSKGNSPSILFHAHGHHFMARLYTLQYVPFMSKWAVSVNEETKYSPWVTSRKACLNSNHARIPTNSRTPKVKIQKSIMEIGAVVPCPTKHSTVWNHFKADRHFTCWVSSIINRSIKFYMFFGLAVERSFQRIKVYLYLNPCAKFIRVYTILKDDSTPTWEYDVKVVDNCKTCVHYCARF